MQNSTFCRRIPVVQGDTARTFRFILEDITLDGTEHARIYARKPSGAEIYDECEIVGSNEVIFTPETEQIFIETGIILAEIRVAKGEKLITSYSFEFEVRQSTMRTGDIPSSDEFNALERAIEEAKGLHEPEFTEAGKRENIVSGETMQILFGKIKKWFTDLGALIIKIGNKDISSIGDGTVTGAITDLDKRSTKNTSDIDVERKRIDNIAKLPEGSTAGDAELADIRVAADGTSYDTAGESVRGQINQIDQKYEKETSSLKEDITAQYGNVLDNNNLVPDVLFDNLIESWGEDNSWFYNWSGDYTYNVSKSKNILYKGFPTLFVELQNATGKAITINHAINLNEFINKSVYIEGSLYIEGTSIPEIAQIGIGRTGLNFENLTTGWNKISGQITVPSNENNGNIRLVVGGDCKIYYSPILITFNYVPNKYTRLTIEETMQEIKNAIKESDDWKQKIEDTMPKNNKNEIPVDFSVQYNYCDDIPLYLYLETLFDEQVSITNGIGGMNQIVQDASIGGFWTQNISGAPKGKKVEIADNKKVLFIGDSYTAAGVYPKHVYDKITSLGKTITLIGTQGEEPYKHEGHHGWRNYTYANCAKGSDDVSELGNTQNPFWNPATEKFDFAYYIQNNNLLTPDIVFINLGTNDFTQTVERTEEETLNAMNTIVNSIKSFDSSIKIIHWCPALTPIGIRGFANHWDGIVKYTDILINNFSNLCPVRYAVSPTEDGQFETKMINGHEYRVLKDWVHLADIGYEHIANMICGYIN